jgi:hypothetical protein
MDEIERFMTETYPRLWHLAYDAGVEARKNGLPRNCNLKGNDHCHNDSVLKVYKSAWEQGWDGYTIPAIFAQIEAKLNQMPLHPATAKDIIN